ncbi:peptidoglycan DD-metalloendopeptidase family protein [Nocardioides mangrovicus]|nr:peptidoglycan DD-metalloendopeptidase family protein [Nocardioides mangrovicus]
MRLIAYAVLGSVLVAPAVASATGDGQVAAKVMSAAKRTQQAPNVFYPLPSSASPTDQQNYRSGGGTDLEASCGTQVRAIHAGTVHYVPSSSWGGANTVEVTTGDGHLTSYYGYLGSITAFDNQIVSAGQPLGTVGSLGAAAGTCELGIQIMPNGTTTTDPTAWLESWVGKPNPDLSMWGSNGFLLATFNVLGASHTKRPGGDASRRYPTWSKRLPGVVSYLENNHIDVAGMQEFQRSQHKAFLKQASSQYAAFPASSRTDTDNTIVWRKDTFDLVEAHKFAIPYFNGHKRNMNYVLLRQKSTGRTAYFINVHNPANTRRYHHQQKWRNRSIAVERKLVIRLRSFNRPVFLTGDLNDRDKAFCPLTKDKLMLSANSVPSFTCAPPSSLWIDWILGAGQTRFSSYIRDWSLKSANVTDHPVVYSRTYLAE